MSAIVELAASGAVGSAVTYVGQWLNARRKEKRADTITAEVGWSKLTAQQRRTYDALIASLNKELAATREELAAARLEFRQYRTESAAEMTSLRAELQSYREQVARMQLLDIEKETKPR